MALQIVSSSVYLDISVGYSAIDLITTVMHTESKPFSALCCILLG